MNTLLRIHLTLESARSNFEKNSDPIFSLSPFGSTLSKRQKGTQTDQPKKKMQLPIARDIIIEDLQKAFQATYPYLNLRFVKASLPGASSTAVKQLCNSSNKLGSELKLLKEGEITIDDSTSVTELINSFQENYGISVQVCRKSGNLWIEITLTSHWTLLQQNNHGKEISV